MLHRALPGLVLPALVLPALALPALAPPGAQAQEAAPAWLPRAAAAMAEALEAEFARAEAMLLGAAAALDPGGPPRPGAPAPGIPLAALDRTVRGAAATLGLQVSGFDARLAPLVDSAVPPGVPLPASAAAELAADALERLAPAMGRVGPNGALGVAVPVTRGPGGRALAALVATLPVPRLVAAMRDAADPAPAAARLVAFGEGPAETLLTVRGVPAEAEAGLAMVAQPLRRMPGWAVLAGAEPEPPPPAPPPPAPPAPAPPAPDAALAELPGWPGRLGALLAGAGAGAILVALLAARGAPSRRQARRDAAEARGALAELRAICDTIPVGLALLDGGGRVVSTNPRLSAFAGLPEGEMLGRPLADVLPPPLAEAMAAGHAQVLREGRPVLDAQIEVEAAGLLRHTRVLLVSCHPVRGVDGAIEAVSAVVQDITERARAEAGRELLMRELNHRVKNSLATVQTIAQQTLRSAGDDLDGFRRSFGARIQALARAHDLLTANDWREAELRAVARAALAPWIEDPRLLVEGGPPVLLSPGQAQALVLGFHELATNAAKYGALTREGGRVRVSWAAAAEGLVTLRWTEEGGPPVTPPARQGFGTRLLERALRADLGAGAEPALAFDPAGLRATIRFRPGAVLVAAG